MNVVSLFDYTGNMVRPWAEAGYQCYCVDRQHKESYQVGNIHYVKADLMTLDNIIHLLDLKPVFVSACPPCTHLAICGAVWFKGKGLRKLADSINMFATSSEFCEASEAPYIIENPMSTISTYWRPPDLKMHPAWYAGYCDEPEKEMYQKETWLWVGGGFTLPPRDMPLELPVDKKYIHYQPPGPERANIRSAAPNGFARAIFEHLT